MKARVARHCIPEFLNANLLSIHLIASHIDWNIFTLELTRQWLLCKHCKALKLCKHEVLFLCHIILRKLKLEYRGIAFNKKDDDRRAILRNAQQALGEVIWGKKEAAGKKRKQAPMDKMFTLCPIKSVQSSMKDYKKSGPKELDAKIAS